MDIYNDLYEMCEIVSKEIGEATEKIRASGGKVSAGDVDYIDKLTHTIKSIKTTLAMMDEEGGSYDDGGSYRRGSYARGGGGRGGSYRGGSYEGGSYDGSYARGRGRNARRDSMGRYSGEGYSRGYSRGGDIAGQLQGLMQDAPNEQIRMELQRLAEKVEQM